jgi:hypothetical protein
MVLYKSRKYNSMKAKKLHNKKTKKSGKMRGGSNKVPSELVDNENLFGFNENYEQNSEGNFRQQLPKYESGAHLRNVVREKRNTKYLPASSSQSESEKAFFSSLAKKGTSSTPNTPPPPYTESLGNPPAYTKTNTTNKRKGTMKRKGTPTTPKSTTARNAMMF